LIVFKHLGAICNVKKMIGRCIRRDKKQCVSLASLAHACSPSFHAHQKMIRSADAALRAATHQIKQQRFFAIVTTIDSRFTDAKPRSNPSIARCWSRSTEQNKLQQREFTCISNNDCGFGRSGAIYASTYLIRFNTDSHNPKTASETLQAPPSPARLRCKFRGRSPVHAGYRE
jgi:hypothetical protein